MSAAETLGAWDASPHNYEEDHYERGDNLQFDGDCGQYDSAPKRRKSFNEEDRCTWRIKGGGCINIKDMTDAHLLNTIHMIDRKKIFTPAWGRLLYEAGRRGLKPDVAEARE